MVEGAPCDEWMGEDLTWGYPLMGIHLKHCFNQVNALVLFISLHHIQVLQGQLMWETKGQSNSSKENFLIHKKRINQSPSWAATRQSTETPTVSTSSRL